MMCNEMIKDWFKTFLNDGFKIKNVLWLHHIEINEEVIKP